MTTAKRILTIGLFTLVFGSFFFAFQPVAEAQGLVPEACRNDVRQCNFCTFMQMLDNLIDLLFQLLIIGAVIMLVIAGLRLVTSGGDVSAYEKAKSMVTNVIIGFIIVLAAWVIVDTIFRVLVQDTRNFGPWNQLDTANCGGVRSQPTQTGGELIESEGGTATP